VPAPPGTVPASAVVPDVEETGSLTPLLDKLLSEPDIAQSSPARRGFPPPSSPSPDRGLADDPSQAGSPEAGPSAQPWSADIGSVTQASIRRLWRKPEGA
jgi:hypothetical protein